MNRLIILGNGFDIAHGLPTKYQDYIQKYWQGVGNSSYEDSYLGFAIDGYDISLRNSLNDILNHFKESGLSIQKRAKGDHFRSSDKRYIIRVKNDFFIRLNEKYDDVNWVDIEMEYYRSIKDILTRDKTVFDTLDKYDTDSNHSIIQLNKDIAEIARNFEAYLKEKVMPQIENCRNSELEMLFSNEEYNIGYFDDFYREFPRRTVNELKSEYSKLQSLVGFAPKFQDTCVLNFNYTNTFKHYISPRKATIVNIHGEIGNLKNPVNLGFGDERDKFYAELEDKNENEYLKYMKSFYYSNNDNYKRLFDFLEDSSFQVQIMGHSCGLSDRTLLNAIFEHKNCKSIKVFYHKYREVAEDGEEDNYTQIIRNISRHFNQKTMMREKIVNKEFCEVLPQNNYR